MLHRYLVTFVLVCCLSGCMAAGGENLLERDSPISLYVVRGGIKSKVVLEITIADWRVSCNRKHAVVWGQTTRELPVGVAPHATVYVVDLTDAVVRKSFTTTRGPFEVEIDETGTFGIVDEYVIELATGNVKFTEIPRDLDVKIESCSDFKGRRLQ